MLQFAPAPGGMLASYSVLQTVIHHLNQGGRRELSDANTLSSGLLDRRGPPPSGSLILDAFCNLHLVLHALLLKKNPTVARAPGGANEHKGKGNGLVLEASSAGLVFIHRSLYTMASSF